MKPFFVYLLRCADGSFYVGHTDELERRVAQHQAGEIDGYTHERRPVELVWSQETATREEALSAERRIKGWGRAKKEALVAGDWERVKELARSRTVRPELVEGLEQVAPGLRQAQPERGANTSASPDTPVRPEPVEGLEQVAPGLRQAQPERGASTSASPDAPVRPELVEGLEQRALRLRQAQPERGAANSVSTDTPVRPEPVEGLEQGAPGLRQAQPERGAIQPEQDATQPEQAVIAAIVRGERRAIAKTITLLESTRADHREQADTLLNALLPHTGNAMRLGISGVPGVGKSTFIEALGLYLIERGHKVAVLAIDPSSSVSGGSILGDKTRMEKLSVHERAYIRPSPASGTLGGVAEKTREAMLVCEAAGYDVVIVETVGVGQSETAVAGMTDMFVLLQLPNAGDDLQAIKKGVMELADLVVINKADLDPDAATRAQAQITSALRIFGFHGKTAPGASPQPPRWTPQVVQSSALAGRGIQAFWEQVERFHTLRRASGEFAARREAQALAWLWDIVQSRLQADFRHHPNVRSALPQTLADVRAAKLAPSAAARSLLNLFEQSSTNN